MNKPPTNRPTDVDNALWDQLIEFYKSSFHLELSSDEALYILVHRFESFTQAYSRFREKSFADSFQSLLKIADTAIREPRSTR